MRLTDRRSGAVSRIIYGDEVIPIDVSFDTVLRIDEAWHDEVLTEIDRLLIAFYNFVPDHKEREGALDLEQISEIVTLAFLEIAGEGGDKDFSSVVDFAFDAERIYTSFKKDYNIDLFEEQGRMSWQKFIALFNGLSDDTPMMRAVYYRTCPLPTGKEHAEERKRIKKLKRHFELPSQAKEREEEVCNAFDAWLAEAQSPE